MIKHTRFYTNFSFKDQPVHHRVRKIILAHYPALLDGMVAIIVMDLVYRTIGTPW